jgi:hypothetical protein
VEVVMGKIYIEIYGHLLMEVFGLKCVRLHLGLVDRVILYVRAMDISICAEDMMALIN